MAATTRHLRCAHCGTETTHVVQSVNHVLHLLMTLFLCGGWLPVWLILVLALGQGSARCDTCGTTRRP